VSSELAAVCAGGFLAAQFYVQDFCLRALPGEGRGDLAILLTLANAYKSATYMILWL
jgi:hypothetical protein